MNLLDNDDQWEPWPPYDDIWITIGTGIVPPPKGNSK